ncbi:MAG TPA: VWA-like domain-containing protein [Oligoflexia bacterium]|nr:VWA-like domain-containing protein [Oligoflexia bacterium]HMP49421.1 VWA-like domain-containing protein [Oligoflexia bacterium]
MDEIDAKKRMDEAIRRVIRQFPFWEVYLISMKLICRKTLPSISLGVGLRLYFNPDYVNRKTVRELAAIILCQLYQVFLSQGKRRNGRDPFVWMLACGLESGGDYQEGQAIGLPPEAVVPAFYSFQAGLTAELYYNLLMDMDEIPLPFSLKDKDGFEILGGPKFIFKPKGDSDDPILAGSELLGEDSKNYLESLGIESWEDEDNSATLEIDPIFEMIQREDTRKEMRKFASEKPGKIPEHLLLESQVGRSRLSWKSELSKLLKSFTVGRSGRLRFSYNIFNPKEVILGGHFLLPGSQTLGVNPLVIIDTSGSMRPEYFKDALGELDGLIKSVCGLAGTSVMACDAKPKPVQFVKTARQFDLIGGGGTDMSIGLQAVNSLKVKPDVVIVMTDGETNWPAESPTEVPVVILIVSPKWSIKDRRNYPPPKWGTLIEMYPSSSKKRN